MELGISPMLDAWIQFNVQQGMVRSPFANEDVFARSAWTIEDPAVSGAITARDNVIQATAVMVYLEKNRRNASHSSVSRARHSAICGRSAERNPP